MTQSGSVDIWSRGKDGPTDWDYLNGSVDGINLHAISTPRRGRHIGTIVTGDGKGTRAVDYPISLDTSVADYTEEKLAMLVRFLRSQ